MHHVVSPESVSVEKSRWIHEGSMNFGNAAQGTSTRWASRPRLLQESGSDISPKMDPHSRRICCQSDRTGGNMKRNLRLGPCSLAFHTTSSKFIEPSQTL